MKKLQKKSLISGISAISFSILSVAGSIAGVWNIFNFWGIIAVGFILIAGITISGFTALTPIFSKNDRGVNFISSLDDIGLVDIETRSNFPERNLPPIKYYEKATDEILITGISLFRTLRDHLPTLKEMVNKKVKIKLLLLSPDSDDILKILKDSEAENVGQEINNALDIIRNESLRIPRSGFEIRLYDFYLPFTGIMIDGDIDCIGNTIHDENGVIRIQPTRIFCKQHDGIVLQFVNNKNEHSGFKIYAEDFRKQWENSQNLDEYYNEKK